MTKKIFTYSLAVAAMLASCNDDFQTYEAGNAGGTKGKLVEAGLIGAGVESESETRAFSPNGSFVWMPEAVESTGHLTADRLNQKVGLCWTGVNNVNAEYGATASAGVNVFTNYEYEHIGWLETNQTEVLLDECSGEIKNGAYIQGEGLTEFSLLAAYTSNWSETHGNVYKGRYNKYYFGESLGKSEAGKELNLGAGIFKTNNATVFEGQYVVYFPYTEKFTRGPIIANSPSYFENVQTGTNLPTTEADQLATASKYAFQMGYITHYEGGNRSSRFLTKNYSSFVRLYLYDGNAGHNDVMNADIKTVILYSPSQGIIYETGVSAASVINNQGDMTKVEKVGAPVTTNALYAHLTDEDTAKEGAYVEWNTTSKTHLVTLPALPQTVEDLKVILINAEDKSMEFSLSDEDKNWIAGKSIKINLNMDSKAFTNTYYAVDEPSFASALNKIAASNNKNAEIRILRNIEMFAKNDTLYKVSNPAYIAFDKNIDITADASCASAQITITSETVRFIESLNSDAQLNVNVPVVVEGYGCCWGENATLNVGGWDGRAEDKVTFGAEVTNYGTVNLGYSIQDQKPAMFKAKVVEAENYFYSVTFKENFYNIWDTEYQNKKGYSKGSKEREQIEGAAKLNISAQVTEDVLKVNFEKSIINDGEIAVNSTDSLTTLDAEGNRSLKVYINDVENTGVLAVKAKDAKAEEDIIGGKISVSENALVAIKNTLKNVNDYAYIVVAGQGLSDTTDGRIDIKNSGESKNEGTIENNGVINMLAGEGLDNTDGLFIDELTGQVGGIAVRNGEQPAVYIEHYYKGVKKAENKYITDLNTGIFVAKTATQDRMAFIITDAVESNSAVVVEVTGVDESGWYNFSDARYKNKDLRKYDVRINSEAPVSFIATAKEGGKYAATKSIGHCVDILAGSVLQAGASDVLNVQKNVFVRTEGALNVTAKIARLNIVNDLIVENGGNVSTESKTAETKSTVNDMKVGHDIKNSGMITSNRNFAVMNDFIITTTGELDSNGIPSGKENQVGNNFELSGKAAFARYTTTIVKGTFNSEAKSQFVREGLGSSDVYRATVNVKKLGKTEGAAQGGWPTQM